MSGSFSRRDALRGFSSAVATLSFVGLGLDASASAQGAGQGVTGTHVLSRMVERDLKDGVKLVVTRSWSIRFDPSGQGTAVFGTQRSVDIDAPARLAPIVQIERDRSTDAMFPILLDEHGLILAAGEMHSAADIEHVVAEAEQILGIGDLPRAQAEQTQSALMQMAQAPSRLIEVMPADLFYPQQPLVNIRKPITLSNGVTGEFVLRYEASADTETGLMRRAERQITTFLGAQARFSRELWTLE